MNRQSHENDYGDGGATNIQINTHKVKHCFGDMKHEGYRVSSDNTLITLTHIAPLRKQRGVD